MAIHAALVREHGFTGHHSSVRRLITVLAQALPPDTTVRLTFDPGDAAQVDFGAGPELIDPATGGLRRTWLGCPLRPAARSSGRAPAAWQAGTVHRYPTRAA